MTAYKVIQAAAFVRRETGHSELIYRGAPVPSDATNVDELRDGGFIVEVGDDEVGGHPSDVRPEDLPADDNPGRRRAGTDAKAAPKPADAAPAADDSASK